MSYHSSRALNSKVIQIETKMVAIKQTVIKEAMLIKSVFPLLINDQKQTSIWTSIDMTQIVPIRDKQGGIKH